VPQHTSSNLTPFSKLLEIYIMVITFNKEDIQSVVILTNKLAVLFKGLKIFGNVDTSMIYHPERINELNKRLNNTMLEIVADQEVITMRIRPKAFKEMCDLVYKGYEVSAEIIELAIPLVKIFHRKMKDLVDANNDFSKSLLANTDAQDDDRS
jgi:hypothetical protein